MGYDFSTLSAPDFEELVCDLMNARQEDFEYKLFAAGRDGGRDFRFSIEGNPDFHVGQVKHSPNKIFSCISSKLRKNELPKVKTLNPDRYIFATSIGLIAENFTTLQEIFEPYIRNQQDIYGKDELNRLLRQYSAIERKHYKLWLSSFNNLTRILGETVENRTKIFVEKKLVETVRLFCETDTYHKAYQKLQDQSLVILKGEPASGKSTIAYMLAHRLMQEGYELSYILDQPSDLENKIRVTDDKQVFLFDDFLGSNSISINAALEREQTWKHIIETYPQLENKMLIFSTREGILERVLGESENLRNLQIANFEVSVNFQDLDEEEKERALKNHIEFNVVDEDKKDFLLQNRKSILQHSNFNPRTFQSIVSICDKTEDPYTFFSQIMEIIDDTSLIWKSLYDLLDYPHRELLWTIFTFERGVDIVYLEEVISFNRTGSNENRSLPRLEELSSFLVLDSTNYIKFLNNSVSDFLIDLAQKDRKFLESVLKNARYFEQVGNKEILGIFGEKYPIEVIEVITKNVSTFKSLSHENLNKISLAKIVDSHAIEDDEPVNQLLISVTDWDFLQKEPHLEKWLADYSRKWHYIDRSEIRPVINNFIYSKIKNTVDFEDLENVLLQLNFDFELDQWVPTNQVIENFCNQLWDSYVTKELEELCEEATDMDEVENIEDELNKKKNEIRQFGIQLDPISDRFVQILWDDIFLENEYNKRFE